MWTLSVTPAAPVSRARFFLHPSFAPHDVVDILAAPFAITRAGWGEFPVRVALTLADGSRAEAVHMLALDPAGPHRPTTLDVDVSNAH
jgi:transcription initiation factor IIF auxiliary subunit